MSITEKEFREMLNNNPQLKIKVEKNKQIQIQQKKGKLNKYRNTKLYEYENGLVTENKKEVNAGKIVAVYDSIKEYNRWCELLLMERANQISELQRQVRLLIQEPFVYGEEKIRAIDYVADFTYIKDGTKIIEDVKPLDPITNRYRLTKDFSLKWKLLKYRYPKYRFEIF